MTKVNTPIIGNAPAPQSLNVEEGAVKMRAGIQSKLRLCGVKNKNILLKLRQKLNRTPTHQVRDTITTQ